MEDTSYRSGESSAAVEFPSVLIFFGKYGKALNEEDSRVYGRVLGFKDYIQKAETDRLKMLVEENPD